LLILQHIACSSLHTGVILKVARYLLLGCAFLFGYFQLQAGNCKEASSTSLYFSQLGTGQGLSHSSIRAIVQDSRGFIWLGTHGGLNRYDGYQSKTYLYSPNDRHSIADNFILSLYLDVQGRLWIGTDSGGLNLFDEATERFEKFLPPVQEYSGTAHLSIKAIVGDGKGGLWLATADGLQHFDTVKKQFTVMRHEVGNETSLSHNRVNTLALDAKNNLWIGTDAGVDLLQPNDNKFVHFVVNRNQVNSQKHEGVALLLIDHAQSVWVASFDGLERWRFSGGNLERHRFGPLENITSSRLSALYQDHDSTIWVGTKDKGLLRWSENSGKFTVFQRQVRDPHSLSDNFVSSLLQDRTGTLWVGTRHGGANRVDLASGGFSVLKKKDDDPTSLSDDRVGAISAASDGKVWIGTNNGLNLFDPKTGRVKNYRRDPNTLNSLLDDQVVSMVCSDPRLCWIATAQGLQKFDPIEEKFSQRIELIKDPQNPSIRRLYKDSKGIIWIASNAGLFRLDPITGQQVSFQHDDKNPASLADNLTRSILVDRFDRVWVGTLSGLDLLDSKTGHFIHFRNVPQDKNSLSHNAVTALFEDKKGQVWVGTGGGLNLIEERIDTGGLVQRTFRRYPMPEGVLEDISSILEDEDGNLWISTFVGLLRFNPVLASFKAFGAGHGISDDGYFAGAAFQSSDGVMYFGGFNSGVTYFEPRKIRNNPYPPPVVVTDFLIFNKSLVPQQSAGSEFLSSAIQMTKTIKLSYLESVFSFEFSALHFADPQHNQYAYQLVGFDDTWVSTTPGKRFATYTNIDHGTYVFRVKAANKDGVWNEIGSAITLTITPPFWKTWWFRVLAALLFIMLIWAGVRARFRIVIMQKKMLEQQVAERTLEVLQQKELVEESNVLLNEKNTQIEASMVILTATQARLVEQEKLAALGFLVAGVAHELNTPIGNCLMAASSMEEHTNALMKTMEEGKISRSQLNSYASIVKEASALLMRGLNHSAKLVSSFKLVAADQSSERRLRFDLESTMIGIVATESGKIRDHHCTIDIAIPKEIIFDSYPNALSQVIHNLIDNSLIHAFNNGQSGNISLSACRLENDRVEIQVCDNGAGIAPNIIAKIFEPFFTTTLGQGSSGLGLSICHNIVTAILCGSISVQSELGKGSRFTLILPIDAPHSTPLISDYVK
jgi:ligand-binding sensor domain-containing protein/signal transduction histidine kinase